jgi:hypothetical protein
MCSIFPSRAPCRIVGSSEIQQRDLAGVSIDFDLGDVRPGRIGEIRRIVKRSLVEAGLDSLDGIVMRHIGRQGDLGKWYGFVGPSDCEPAILELERPRRDLVPYS